MQYLRYHADLETLAEDEAEVFNEIAETFAKMGRDVAAHEGRPLRVSHAKSTGVLKGALEIDANLPPELAQGLCAQAGRYEALVRLAQGPGERLGDEVSTHRGLAVKILSVSGERIAQDLGGASQDFVLEAGETAFINATAKDFLLNLKAGVSKAPKLAEGVKAAVSKASLAVNTALEAVSGGSKILGFFGHPSLHPLSEAYFSQAPLRWGDYFAKVGFFPTQATLDSLAELKLDTSADHEAFRHAVVAHFAAHGATFELRVQLAVDLDTMPIENASKRWPEDQSPYRRVALLTLPEQSWSKARVEYFDAVLSFRPAHSLAAHRPMGQVMRARLFAYERLAALRQTGGEAAGPAEPRTLSEVPN